MAFLSPTGSSGAKDPGVRTIYVYDFDAVRETIAYRCAPDGLAIGDKGFLQRALGSGKLLHHDPQGKGERTILVPLPHAPSAALRATRGEMRESVIQCKLSLLRLYLNASSERFKRIEPALTRSPKLVAACPFRGDSHLHSSRFSAQRRNGRRKLAPDR